MSGTIPLRKNQLEQLKKSKSFVRNLSEGKVKKIDLSHQLFNHNIHGKDSIAILWKTHSKVYFSTHRKMGKSKEKDMNLKEVIVQLPTQKVMNQEIQKKEDFTVESPVDSPVIVKKIQDNLSKKKQIGMGKKKSQIFLYHPMKKRSKGTSLLRHLENNKNIS